LFDEKGAKAMANLRYLKDVTTLQLDTEKCIGCKKCTEGYFQLICQILKFTIQNFQL